MTVASSRAEQTAAPQRSSGSRFHAAGLAWLAAAAIETAVGVGERWPAQFAGKGDPATIATGWMTTGTVLSPPLFMMIALAAGLGLTAVARRRAVKIAGAAITITVGLIGTVFTIGEAAAKATAAVPPGAHLGALIGTALSLAVVVTGISFVRSAR